MSHRKPWGALAMGVLLLALAFSTAACSTIDLPSSFRTSEATSSATSSSTAAGSTSAKVNVPQPSGIPPAATNAGLPAMGFWAVWCGSSRTMSGVQPLQRRLEAQGFPTDIAYTPEWEKLDVSPWYALFIGPYSDKKTANKALTIAKSLGYKDFRVQFSGPTTVNQGSGYVKSGVDRSGVQP